MTLDWIESFRILQIEPTNKCSIECKTIVYEFFSKESKVSKVQIIKILLTNTLMKKKVMNMKK